MREGGGRDKEEREGERGRKREKGMEEEKKARVLLACRLSSLLGKWRVIASLNGPSKTNKK